MSYGRHGLGGNEDAGLWNNRGVTLAELKRLEEASASFGRAAALEPNYAGAFCNRANTLILLTDSGAAPSGRGDASQADG